MVSVSRQARAGFTLIEILIAMAIVVILGVTVGLPMLKFVTGARDTAAKSALKAIKVGVQNFYIEVGRYPETLRDLVEKPQNEEIAEDWKGPYIEGKNALKDPWKRPYQYQETPGAEHPYELYSYGDKGKSSTSKERISVWDL